MMLRNFPIRTINVIEKERSVGLDTTDDSTHTYSMYAAKYTELEQLELERFQSRNIHTYAYALVGNNI